MGKIKGVKLIAKNKHMKPHQIIAVIYEDDSEVWISLERFHDKYKLEISGHMFSITEREGEAVEGFAPPLFTDEQVRKLQQTVTEVSPEEDREFGRLMRETMQNLMTHAGLFPVGEKKAMEAAADQEEEKQNAHEWISSSYCTKCGIVYARHDSPVGPCPREDAGERALVQLTGCLFAAEGNADNTEEGDYGWSPALDAVKKLWHLWHHMTEVTENQGNEIIKKLDRIVSLRNRLTKSNTRADMLAREVDLVGEEMKDRQKEIDALRANQTINSARDMTIKILTERAERLIATIEKLEAGAESLRRENERLRRYIEGLRARAEVQGPEKKVDHLDQSDVQSNPKCMACGELRRWRLAHGWLVIHRLSNLSPDGSRGSTWWSIDIGKRRPAYNPLHLFGYRVNIESWKLDDGMTRRVNIDARMVDRETFDAIGAQIRKHRRADGTVFSCDFDDDETGR